MTVRFDFPGLRVEPADRLVWMLGADHGKAFGPGPAHLHTGDLERCIGRKMKPSELGRFTRRFRQGVEAGCQLREMLASVDELEDEDANVQTAIEGGRGVRLGQMILKRRKP